MSSPASSQGEECTSPRAPPNITRPRPTKNRPQKHRPTANAPARPQNVQKPHKPLAPQTPTPREVINKNAVTLDRVQNELNSRRLFGRSLTSASFRTALDLSSRLVGTVSGLHRYLRSNQESDALRHVYRLCVDVRSVAYENRHKFDEAYKLLSLLSKFMDVPTTLPPSATVHNPKLSAAPMSPVPHVPHQNHAVTKPHNYTNPTTTNPAQWQGQNPQRLYRTSRPVADPNVHLHSRPGSLPLNNVTPNQSNPVLPPSQTFPVSPVTPTNQGSGNVPTYLHGANGPNVLSHGYATAPRPSQYTAYSSHTPMTAPAPSVSNSQWGPPYDALHRPPSY